MRKGTISASLLVTLLLASALALAADESAKKTEKAKEPKWERDFEKAKALATKTKRPILVDFSGSDWCGWCIKLDKEVFSKKEFKEYAEKNLVLFIADFPRSKKLPEAEAAQNKKLAAKYSVQGFPTVLLLNPKGDVVGKTGYRPGGPDKYTRRLTELAAKGQKERKAASGS